MDYIHFDKNQLVNLEYSLNKEMIRSNRAGSFSCTTILGCNTRKYHGLLITPQPGLDGENHVLLSKVDETLIQQDAEFNIGVNRFPGTYFPKGHKYVRDFSALTIPVITYQAGDMVLTRETMFASQQERIMIRYTLVEASAPVLLRLRPFLAFRNIHSLSKRNDEVDTSYQEIQDGISLKPYQGYGNLYLQFSRQNSGYVHNPDWYHDFEYAEEKDRGFDYHEDLFSPGYFEINVKKGESVVFSASTKEIYTPHLARLFNQEMAKRTPRNSLENCLSNAAEQFFIADADKSGVVAGYPWFGQMTRYTFIALPGLLHATNDIALCEDVMASLINDMKGPVFPELRTAKQISYDSADTPLWFFYALQKCFPNKSENELWDQYGHVMTTILNGYVSEEIRGVGFHENGLLYIHRNYPWLTWMNAVVNDQAVTPRYGYVVEVNALWYNALAYVLRIAAKTGNTDFAGKWQPVAERSKASFNDIFWAGERYGLADWVFDSRQDLSVRPNQIIAASLPYCVLDEAKRKAVLDVVGRELLTPRGLRSLSPNDMNYTGTYEGNTHQRDRALHQGTIWPWLLAHFADAYTGLYGTGNLDLIKNLYDGFQEVMKENGIGTVSELFDGDPPHKAKGAPSFAPSVAALAYLSHIINNLSHFINK